jgi:protein-S-isoprenylcysteine O-methyltransferase Ste14
LNTFESLDRVSIAGVVLAAGGLIQLFWRGALFGRGAVSIGIQVASIGLLLWARIIFGRRSFRYRASPTPGGVVTVGPYRYIRHPIYASILYFSGAGVASNWSVAYVVPWLAVALGLGLRMACEERLLTEHYPAYADYASQTKRIAPFVV